MHDFVANRGEAACYDREKKASCDAYSIGKGLEAPHIISLTAKTTPHQAGGPRRCCAIQTPSGRCPSGLPTYSQADIWTANVALPRSVSTLPTAQFGQGCS
jgi:hypothetical protein